MTHVLNFCWLQNRQLCIWFRIWRRIISKHTESIFESHQCHRFSHSLAELNAQAHIVLADDRYIHIRTVANGAKGSNSMQCYSNICKETVVAVPLASPFNLWSIFNSTVSIRTLKRKHIDCRFRGISWDLSVHMNRSVTTHLHTS